MELKKYLAMVRHWLWLILLGASLSGVLAFAINRSRTPIYRASASYLIDVAAGGSSQRDYAGRLIAEGLVNNYLEIIPTTTVMAEVIAELQTKWPALAEVAPEDLLRSVSVSTPLETEIIVISVTDPIPARAADLVNMIGAVFSRQNQERFGERYSAPIQKLDTQLGELDAQLTQVRRELSEKGEPTSVADELELSRVNRQLNELEAQYNSAFESRLELDIEQERSVNRFLEVEPAVAPDGPISPRVWTNTILAIIVGGMLALGIILLIEYLDDTIKTPDEAQAHTGLATLATIGFIKNDDPGERLIAFKAPRAPISEAFRVLRTNMSFAAIDTGLRSALITSSSPGEGKSTTSANTAIVLAQAGKKVILIDADLRRPTQHKLFNVSNNQGLTTALLDNVTPIVNHIQETPIHGLRVMASGPLPPNPAELLNSQRMRDVLDELMQTADIVLLDTPPVLTVADAAILAPHVDGCVLVAEVGSTRHDTLIDSTERLRSTGAALFGLVLNRTRSGRTGYYQYYYDRYYSYDYKVSSPKPQGARRILARLLSSGNQ